MNLFQSIMVSRVLFFSIGVVLSYSPIALAQSETGPQPSTPDFQDETGPEGSGLRYFGDQESISVPQSQTKRDVAAGEGSSSPSDNDKEVFGVQTPHNPTTAVPNYNVTHQATLNSIPTANKGLAETFHPSSLLNQVPDQLQENRLAFADTPFSSLSDDARPRLWRYGKLFTNSSSKGPTEPESPYGEISLILNPAVERNIRYFQTVIPERFQEWLNRFQKYKPVVEQIFAELGLPQELVYLSVIESGFNPRAYSRARAAGPWQFMKGTGRIYGLQVNWYVDERRDPIKSSVAAAQHLRDLYDRFSSWPLALAAYNAGAGKITRAIRKSGTRDYWKIRKTRYIRRETREYVPKYMAATIIATNPTLFGFQVETDEVHKYDEVLMNNTIHLRTVAKKTGLEFDDLRRLNPELRRSITPPDKEGYFLKVPVGMGYHVENVRDELKQWSEPPPHVTWYRVRRGDSLSVIAHRFHTSVSKLRSLNNLRGNLINVGQRLRVSEGVEASDGGAGDAKWYRVRRGDSLWTIAKRFSVSVRDLQVLNNLSSSAIRAGRMLMVSP